MRLSILLFMSILFLQGCSSGKLSSQEELYELINGTTGRGSDMWRGTFYCGTDEKGHHILHTVDMAIDDWYLLPMDQVSFEKQIAVTKVVTNCINISDYKNHNKAAQ